MAQLPQIRRDVLQRIFTNPNALRAYEALQEALANTPDDVVTLYAQVGEARAQAENAIAKAASAEQQAQLAKTRAGFALRATLDAGGQTLDVVPEELVLTLLPYLPRPPQPQTIKPDDTQFILASRIFGVR